MQIRYNLLCLAFLIFSASTAGAQTDRSRYVLHTVKTNSVNVDGVLDEPDWSKVKPATDFTNYRPNEGVPTSQKTEAYVLYGDSEIYVGAILYETDPSLIRRVLTRRDETSGADQFVVAIDSYNDKKTAYLFGVSAAGVQYDGLVTGTGDDDSWDAVWESAVRHTNEGWVVEMAIPYSQLRFSEGESTWGLEFKRDIRRTGEESFWAPFTSAEAGSGLAQMFGTLEGLVGIKPKRAVQVVPYSLARANRFENPNESGVASADYSGDVGVDFRVGLSSNITLDATVNPDFGQVEADPAELNLSTFETFFQERRPFFLEGTQIFDYTYGSGDGALLYTRRIGSTAPVIGATKISGRSPGGLSFGVLGAVTGEDFDPDRFYAATRLKQEFGEQNYFGGAITGFSFNDPASPSPAVTSMAAGVDWDVRVGAESEFKFDGSLAGSLRKTDDSSLEDPTKRGYALYMGFDKVRGFFTPGSGFRVYSPDFEIDDVGRFRQTNLIQARLGTSKVWNRGEPFGPLLRVETRAFGDQNWSYTDGTNRGADLSLYSSGTFANFWSVDLSADFRNLGGLDIRETRGNGPINSIRSIGFGVGVESDDRKRFEYGPDFAFAFGEDGARTFEAEFEASWNASDRIKLSSDVGYTQTNNAVRWTANEAFIRTADGLFVGESPSRPDDLLIEDLVSLDVADTDALLSGIPEYDGNLSIPNATGYYLPVFGSRDTRDFGWSTRANVIFTSKLSLQMYGQLFAARGQFSDFEILASPGELRDFVYPKRPDFAFQSFHSSVVLRWEYRPGSTLFVVWTQSRNLDDAETYLLATDDLPPSPFDQTTGDQLRDTFRVFPDNVFLIKLNYLFRR